MCATKELAKTKVDRLIIAVERLCSLIEQSNARQSGSQRSLAQERKERIERFMSGPL